MSDKIYQFDGFTLNPQTRELSFDNKPLEVGSRAFDILLLLIENRGEVVEKEEILTRVWQKAFVEEANLPVHIGALRKILADDQRENKFIKTVSGQGYCFVRPVSVGKSAHKETNTASNDKIDPEAMKLYLRGITIVESRIISSDIKETLLRAIDFFRAAISLQTDFSLAYIGIGTVYVSLHNHKLIESDISENEAKKALQLAKNLGENLSEIYVLEASIRHFIENKHREAIVSLTKAVELDSENPDAYHWLGLVYNSLCEFDKAIEFAHQAIRLDPTNLRRSAQLTRYYFRKQDFNNSIKYAEEILAYNPNDAAMYFFLAFNYIELNLFELAFQNINKAIEIRTIAEFEVTKAYVYARAGESKKALEEIDAILRKYHNFEISKTYLALIYDCLGDTEKAFELLFDALAEKSGDLYAVQSDFRYARIKQDARFKSLLEKAGLSET